MASEASTPANANDSPEPAPITDQEVGEYREQDRFLPVSFFLFIFQSLNNPTPDRQCLSYHEIFRTPNRKNRKGRKRMRPRMCIRIHILYHFRSSREMSTRKTKDHRRRGHSLRHGNTRL